MLCFNCLLCSATLTFPPFPPSFPSPAHTHNIQCGWKRIQPRHTLTGFWEKGEIVRGNVKLKLEKSNVARWNSINLPQIANNVFYYTYNSCLLLRVCVFPVIVWIILAMVWYGIAFCLWLYLTVMRKWEEKDSEGISNGSSSSSVCVCVSHHQPHLRRHSYAMPRWSLSLPPNIHHKLRKGNHIAI